MSNKELFWLGVRNAVPIMLGYIPVGIAFAVGGMQAGFSAPEVLLTSLLVYSGSGQILMVTMTAQGAGFAAIVLGTFLINFRYFIMSLFVYSRLSYLPVRWRMASSFFIVDEAFAMFAAASGAKAKFAYLLGLMALSYSSWFLGALIGVMANSLLPVAVSGSLGIALYALFAAIVIAGAKQNLRLLMVVIMTALLNCLTAQFLGISMSLLLSTLIGAFIGSFVVKDAQEEIKEQQHGA